MCMCCIISTIAPGVPAIAGAGVWIKAKLNKSADNNLEKLAAKHRGEGFQVKISKSRKKFHKQPVMPTS